MTTREALDRTLLLCRDSILIGQNDVSDEQLLASFLDTTVLVVADEANLSAPAGQHALVALLNLVARLGTSVRLAIPDVPVLGFQPPLPGFGLSEGLLDLGDNLIPNCKVTLDDGQEPTDIVFVLGDSPWHGKANFGLRLSGDQWSGSTLSVPEQGQRWTGPFPIGALVAAGIAAPEVFKYALRRLGTHLPYPMGDEYLAPVQRAQVRVAPQDTGIGPYELGAIDLVSGGAISNAILFTLLHVPDLTARIRIIEPETIDLSNMNRYVLARRSDCSLPKVDVLSAWQRRGVNISGVPVPFSAVTRDQILPFAPHVLVGTDDIPARWAVQSEWPEWLGVGATSHFMTMTSSHQKGHPCAGCLHTKDDPDNGLIPTVSFVSYWAGLLLAVRLLRHILGESQDGADQQIYCVPLQLGGKRAYWPMKVAWRRDCPVKCTPSL